eukprot:TRINITY_DN66546_c11_g2_i2.p1 TRINITY_DN66546_c11_g2~~TRINITY_DN66546_c11_g2_i2.p1  ORF type:complete len:484 (-),score=264.11 TRINITY_DN66546_c11_g2_i2:104-1507(-)
MNNNNNTNNLFGNNNNNSNNSNNNNKQLLVAAVDADPYMTSAFLPDTDDGNNSNNNNNNSNNNNNNNGADELDLPPQDKILEALLSSDKDSPLKNQVYSVIPKEKLKIFVYDLPTKFNHMIFIAHPSCETSAFGTEIHIHNQLLKSKYRTYNPEEAHLFYVPVYSACLVYRNFRHFPAYRRLIHDAIEHIIHNYPYWNRTRGQDHVWAFVHDYGGCLSWFDNLDTIYYKELRNSIFVSHLGDLDMGCFQTFKDVVIPPMSANPDVYRYGYGGAGQNMTRYPKSTFIHFRGTVKWYHHNDIPYLGIKRGYSKTYSKGIRALIKQLYSDDPLFSINEGSSPKYVEEVRRSVFCLCPRGFAAWSQRLFDSVMLGCIPVIIADNIELPFEHVVDYRKFSVKIDEKDIHMLREILMNIPESEIKKKQEYMKIAWKVFSWQRPSEEGDAFETLIGQLARKVRRLPPAGPESWV